MSMDIEKSVKSYKEGSSEEKRHVIASGVGAAIGGYIGGYPGMQIGMSIMGYLFKPDPPKDKDYYNDEITRLRSKLDPVPDVIGTDMCPGKPIWVGKNTFGMYESGQLPDMGDSTNKQAWIDFLDMMATAKIGQYAEFAINFSGRYNRNINHLGVVYVNEKPLWFWTMFSDMFENVDDPLEPYSPITLIDGSQYYWIKPLDVSTLINMPVDDKLVMYWKGFIADFSQLFTDPSQSNFQIDLYNMAEMNPIDFQMGSLTTFPTFKAEVNRQDVQMSPESMQGGYGFPTSVWFYNETGTPKTTMVFGSAYNNLTGKYNKLVGISGQPSSYDHPTVCDPVKYTLTFPGSDYSGTMNYDLIDAWFKANISPGGTILQCTDMFDDRQYICRFRNWYNPYQGRGVYGIDKVDHHHAEYGVKFDLYYHDMTRDDCYVHSVLYNYEYTATENDYLGGNYNPRYSFGSMRVDDTYIYLFGKRIQTDFVLTDQREIVEGANSYTRCYADFSQYPDDYWTGWYAALQQESYYIYATITNQTSTYIDVYHDNLITGGWGKVPVAGEVVQLHRHRQTEAGLAVAGEGCTTSLIICNPPSPPDWCSPAASKWQKAGFAGISNQENCSYEDEDDTSVTLSSPLSRVPNPGEIIYFTDPDENFDEDETNPLISTESDSSELIEMLLDKGFTNTNVRWQQFSVNEFGVSHNIVLRINKNTGTVNIFKDDHFFTPWTYGFYWWTGDTKYLTCQTDKQAFVYCHELLYGTSFSARTYIIDFTSGDVEEEVHMANQYAYSHTPQWCYHGCVPAKEWNGTAWVDTWYTVLTSYDSYSGLNDSSGQGNYFLKLGDGKFSNKKVYSSNITLREGLDINRRGIEVLLFRERQATGPLYGGIYTEEYRNENEYHLGKVNLHNEIYFRIYKGDHANIFPTNELWKYIPPSDKNPAGVLYMLHKTWMTDTVTNDNYQWNRMDTSPNFQQVITGFHGGGNSGIWYHCDESPPDIIEGFWNDYEDPRYFPSDYKWFLEINEAKSICNEYIPAKVYKPEGTYEIEERRFQFSKCYEQSTKMHDVIKEILETCQGFMSQCIWNITYSDYWKIIIPNKDETPVHYFGRDSAILTSNQLSDNVKRIYADFSAYPDDFWKGDEIDFGEVMDHWHPWPDSQTNVITEQTSTYITLGMSLADYWPDAKQFTLIKDNITEGSFTFAEKSQVRRPNKVRIEFKNRMLGYIKDVAEAEDLYRLDVLGEVEKIDFYKMHGIKRATQAGRLAQRILDQWNYQKYICGFETDIMGMTLCMGEIIALKHETTGWDYKWFRIMSMEELMDFEVKIELEEFNPYTYHDSGVPVMNGSAYGGFPQPYQPQQVKNFTVHEDIEFNRLYFTFDPPTYDSGFFVGARIYYYDGSSWVYFAIISETVSSVKLDQDVNETDTTIYYDPDTVTGTFPTQGIIWLEDELIYYHGLDTTNYAFTNCVRGYKDTVIAEHLIEDDITIKLRDDATQYAEIPSGWEGTTKTFKAAAFTIHQLTANIASAPTASIDIVGYGLLPYFPESIHKEIPEIAEVEYIFENLGMGDLTEVFAKVLVELDALLQKTISTSTSMDALLSKYDVLRTTALDALLAEIKTVSTELDAILVLPSPSVETQLDALLKALDLTETTSLDALLNKIGQTISTDLDAELFKQQVISTVMDAILQQVNIERTTQLDAIIASTVNAVSIYIGANQESVALDALLQKLFTSTTELDALLTKADQTETMDLDAYLQELGIEKTTEIDALLQELNVETSLQFDALLTKGAIVSVTLDALIQKIGIEKTTELDALLLSPIQISTNIDALLNEINKTQTLDLDALLTKSISKEVFLDAILFGGTEINTNLDALLKKLATSETTLDSLIASTVNAVSIYLGTQQESVAIDALLYKAKTISAFLDALVKELDLTFTTDLDALLNKLQSASTELDAILFFPTHTIETELDALLQGVQTIATQLDAILYEPGELRVAQHFARIISTPDYQNDNLRVAQVFARVISTPVYSNDNFRVAQVFARVISTYNTRKTVELDAYLQAEYTISTSMDAICDKDQHAWVGLDAILEPYQEVHEQFILLNGNLL